jgi:hypothetical protein
MVLPGLQRLGICQLSSDQFDIKEASQTRDYCVAKNATQRAARPDSFGCAQDRLFAAQRTLAQDDNQTDPLPKLEIKGKTGILKKRLVRACGHDESNCGFPGRQEAGSIAGATFLSAGNLGQG